MGTLAAKKVPTLLFAGDRPSELSLEGKCTVCNEFVLEVLGGSLHDHGI